MDNFSLLSEISAALQKAVIVAVLWVISQKMFVLAQLIAV